MHYRKPGMPLAVVEAKDNAHGARDGIRQALDPFDRIGSVPRIIREFGGKSQYLGAVRELGRGLYQQAAH